LQVERIVIAIDGPAGSGKSTLGKALARRFNFQYVDSGAVYRAVAKKALDASIDLENTVEVAQIAQQSNIGFEGDPDRLQVFLDGADVTAEIRSPSISHAASVIATVAEVRAAVVQKLRDLARSRSVVMDGRDIGTRVFPDAQIKLFLDASVEVRAQRRREEDLQRGRDVSFDQVRSEMEARDRRDTERAATPLVKADDAILIDSSSMSVEGVVERVLEIMKGGR
jgi:cytidylate kinase